jgi:VanZ family protein
MIRLEVAALATGLASVVVALFIPLIWSVFPEIMRTYFLGGEPGAVVVGFGVLVGIVGSMLFVINLFRRQFTLWWVRLLTVLALYLGLATAGAT